MKNLARKICKIIFLQDFDQILQENYLTIFLGIFLQDFLAISCKKSSIFSARLARYVQDLVQDLVRKILSRFAYYLQDGFYWEFPVQPTANTKQAFRVQATANNQLNIPETVNR